MNRMPFFFLGAHHHSFWRSLSGGNLLCYAYAKFRMHIYQIYFDELTKQTNGHNKKHSGRIWELYAITANASNNHNYAMQFDWIRVANSILLSRFSGTIALETWTQIKCEHFVIKWKPINNSLFNSGPKARHSQRDFPWMKCIDTHGKPQWQTTENQQRRKNSCNKTHETTPGAEGKQLLMPGINQQNHLQSNEKLAGLCELRIWSVYQICVTHIIILKCVLLRLVVLSHGHAFAPAHTPYASKGGGGSRPADYISSNPPPRAHVWHTHTDCCHFNSSCLFPSLHSSSSNSVMPMKSL